MLLGSGVQISSKCGVTRVTGVTGIDNLMYLLNFMGGYTDLIHKLSSV